MIRDIIKNNETTDVSVQKIKKLKQVIPNCFDKDGNLCIEILKQELGDNLSFSKESFELNFLGKSYAKMIAGLDTETVISPDEEHNSKKENQNSENVYISGDNLDALKHLLKAYEGKIKCIYIDPPYNTGSDGFVYNDSFSFNKETLIDKLDISEQEAERILSMTSGNSSSHSAWLSFMYPRLYLARQLMTEDGVIFISIDDNEQSNLKLLCDNIFGFENFVGMLSVENNPKGRKNSNFISISNEYCLIYAKEKDSPNAGFQENIPKSVNDMVQNEDGEFIQAGGRRVLVGEQTFNNVANYNSEKYYSVYYNKKNNDMKIIKEQNINDIDQNLIDSGYKRYISYNDNNFVENTYTITRFKKLFEEESLIFADKKIYEKNSSTTVRIKSMLTNKKYDAIINGKIEKNFEIDLKTTSAGTRLKELFNLTEVPFSSPKNEKFISLLISLFDDKNLICLDFFSGSATTAHAIMQLNATDGGNRKYILVQLPEDLQKNYDNSSALGKKTIKTQIDYLKSINKPLFLDEIGKERIILAAQKIKKETNANIDYGFKHYTLKTTPDNLLNKLETFEPNELYADYDICKEYGINTILETWKLKDGYNFSTKITSINLDGYEAYKCEDCLYFINPNITINNIKSLLEKYNTDEHFTCDKFVLFGYSFVLSEIEMIKNNVKQIKNFKNIDVKVYTRY